MADESGRVRGAGDLPARHLRSRRWVITEFTNRSAQARGAFMAMTAAERDRRERRRGRGCSAGR
ncbi:hypothetical protein HBB16_00655 [Pseudonocardia sp. MCCB 268]|nr:hypothetical protein [Pseudonocardia cytotoxica]